MHQQVIDLLKSLIRTPSFSKQEDKTAEVLQAFFSKKKVTTARLGNNVWAKNEYFDEQQPTVLLNSHHDTVKPASGYTNDPFNAFEQDGKLFGLGSNDAGGALVSLIAAFLHFYHRQDLPFNIMLAASAEEEISGKNGIAALLPSLGDIWVGIVGEPTLMQMAIAEKGLMVVDGIAHGKSGHAARNEGENALYKALEDIEWIRTHDFERKSEVLGAVKATVTQIEAGTQHNVVPDRCSFVIDVRTNECYSNQEVFEILQANTKSELKARSFRLNSSGIALDHPLVKSGLELGWSYYGSPTLSDQALMSFPTLKLGPGDSSRSHTANEFIFLDEIRLGIEGYIGLLEHLATSLKHSPEMLMET